MAASIQKPPPVRAARSRLHARGFTLIELIAVIVILAALVAVAIPLYDDWFRTTLKERDIGVVGAFRAALNQARAACQGFGAIGTGTIDLSQLPPGALDFNANCYPVGTSYPNAASTATLPTSTQCAELFRALLPTVPVAIEGVTPSLQGYAYLAGSRPDINGCAYYSLTTSGNYIYTPGNVAYIGYSISAGVVWSVSPFDSVWIMFW